MLEGSVSTDLRRDLYLVLDVDVTVDAEAVGISEFFCTSHNREPASPQFYYPNASHFRVKHTSMHVVDTLLVPNTCQQGQHTTRNDMSDQPTAAALALSR